MTLSVMWFRRDFRLQDNTALYHAVKEAQQRNVPILFIYHLDPVFTENNTPNHRYFFAALDRFVKRCEKLGIYIHIIEGTWQEAFSQLLEHFPEMSSLYYNQDEVGAGQKRDEEIDKFFLQRGIKVSYYIDYTIHGAIEVKKADDSIYKVFTPYFKKWIAQPKRDPYILTEEDLTIDSVRKDSLFSKGQKMLSNLQMFSDPNSVPHEEAARKLLKVFLQKKIDEYDRFRDVPSADATSRLSVHLRTGTISARTVLYHIQEKQQTSYSTGMDTFIKELAWRDFYNMIYHHHPGSKSKEIDDRYRELKWNDNTDLLEKWKDGKTGFPIVDAGMRQLNEEGWMHNRIRMITASFLTKDLLMDWRFGERYFEETLHDYDEASNIGGWQWASSVGTDAVPYFRVFNPITQSNRFDSKGEYIKKYLPELAGVPEKFIHEPWKMNELDQKEAGCVIGKDYPSPVVDHAIQRKKAIQMFQELK
ncbi:deoxyribodipyrimidine photo-lyase [Bacillus sp. RO1]|uniref:cryptochrome/photolyase family protein n=1 Tax=Bacillus sp. RO1 TaxID=2722703 RepID=UPI00145756FC|nr:deoxyribodipyrimidine photo-lyase [Bacillus sp. RO1]NLP50818.1 deoxyribodipyrimidine photo-lyase [Bacillus sp. RO1]